MALQPLLLATDSGLKPRIIFGSLGLAVIVSLIFIAVAYRLSTELGLDVQTESVETRAKTLVHALEFDAENHTHQGLNTSYLEHLVAQNFNDASILVTWDGQTKQYGQIPADALAAKMNLMKNGEGKTGLIETSSQTYMWARAKSPNIELSVFLLTPVDVFTKGLDAISKRLMFVSFITLWVAIWGALSLSAIISKRFETINSRLRDAASRDNLTGLYNRAYMLEAFEARLLTHDKNEAPSPGAFLLMGVNKFKEINETIGNIGADECLKILALKFSKLVPPSSVVYRYGGDEFACWIEGANEQQIESIAQSFVAAANEAITVKGWTFNLSLSVGIALFPRDAIDSKDIIHCADIALQDAKRSRQALLFYNPQYDENTQLKALLRNQVPGAIARADFSMFFQPKIDLATGAIAGVEALARWHHPTLGNIPPDVFIPLVEQGREINAFSRLMLHTAIQQAKSWQVEGKYIPIAVNLSPYNLLDNQLVEFIQTELEAADLAPELLAVELTESATMFDVNLAQRVFTELRDMGIKISIDDFGTGMSSMSYLQILPIDCVKLDRSFIENIQTDKVAHAIVSCMVSLCHTLGKTVVAEGVETESQSKALREIGCDQAQGYLFARPLRVNDKELIDWFRAEVPAIAMDTGNRA